MSKIFFTDQLHAQMFFFFFLSFLVCLVLCLNRNMEHSKHVVGVTFNLVKLVYFTNSNWYEMCLVWVRWLLVQNIHKFLDCFTHSHKHSKVLWHNCFCGCWYYCVLLVSITLCCIFQLYSCIAVTSTITLASVHKKVKITFEKYILLSFFLKKWTK